MIKEIVKKVKIKMDEISPFADGILTSEELNPLDKYIEDSLPSAYRSLLLRSPIFPRTDIEVKGTIEDFIYKFEIQGIIKLVSFRLSSWKRPAKIISTNSQEYQMQMNPYTRGSATKPIVVQVGDTSFEAYTANSGDSAKAIAVMPINFETQEIPKVIEEAFYYEVAGIVYAMLEDKLAETMFAIANKLIGYESR